MNRFKFRVWDTGEKRWVTYSEYQCLPDDFIRFQDGNPLFTLKAREIEPNRFVIQQWTGFKDKNGIEIYEGDVLSYGVGPQYQVVWNTQFAKFEFPTITHQDGAYSIPIGKISESTIVGNILENPQFLEYWF